MVEAKKLTKHFRKFREIEKVFHRKWSMERSARRKFVTLFVRQTSFSYTSSLIFLAETTESFYCNEYNVENVKIILCKILQLS